MSIFRNRTTATPKGEASVSKAGSKFLFEEFDSGSERTLAAWIRHASRTEIL
jgi:hypothetical protein